MASGNLLVVRDLSQDEIETLLARHHVGRIAYSYQDRVDIEPIHYVFADGWIWARTSPGTKLAVVRHNWWVAFEVDEIDGFFDWRSAVVHGGLYVLSREGTAQDEEIWRRGLELLRRLVPETLTEQDPTPARTVLFRIAVQEAEGREAMLRPA